MNPSSHNCYGDILITKRTLLKRTNQSKSERAQKLMEVWKDTNENENETKTKFVSHFAGKGSCER